MNIGFGKFKITPELTSTSMQGFGDLSQIAKSIKSDLFARSFYAEQDQERILLINLEICFITQALRDAILSKLSKMQEFKGILKQELIVSAQNTHSAPGGVDHYPFFNMSTPGFVKENFTAYVDGACESAKLSFNNKELSTIAYAEDFFSPSQPVAFNRSLEAYLENPEVTQDNLGTDKHLAVDRRMRALIIKNSNSLMGCLNWFGVHGSSLPRFNHEVSGDNKGYAATSFETSHSNVVSIFNQSSAGDVSPNWIWDSNLRYSRGLAQDPFKNAEQNGELQANKLQTIVEKFDKHSTLSSTIDNILIYKNFSNIVIDREFLQSENVFARTSHACLGVSFLEGVKEGFGLNIIVTFILKALTSLIKLKDIIYSLMVSHDKKMEIWDFYRSQGKKNIFLNGHKKEIFGFKNLNKLPVPGFINPVIGIFRSYFNNGALAEHTWLPEVLPIQLSRIGEVILCSLPAEVSTIASKRIENQLLAEFRELGINEVIISSYSNSYCGYITTPEEYEIQLFEGANTLFGKWTLLAFQTVLKKICLEFKKEKKDRDLSWTDEPLQFSEANIAKRSSK